MALLHSVEENILSQSHLVAVVLASLLLCAVLAKSSRRRRRKLNLPPGPWPLPLVGNLHQLGSMPNVSLNQLANKYGPILHLTLGQVPTVIISSSRLAREVLRTYDLQLASRPRLYAAKYLFYGCTDVAFSPYGSYWRTVRKICIVELLSSKRVESYAVDRELEVARMVQRVAKSAHPETVDVTHALALYANGVLCRAAFGKDFSEGGDYDRHDFHQMLHDYQVLLGGFLLADFYPSLEWINALTGTNRLLQSTWRRFDRLFDEVIHDHMERREKGDQDHQRPKDLVDVLLDVQASGDQEVSLTMDNIKAVILDMFAAGTDTTFTTLDWAMTELIMNPRAMEKAQLEVQSIVGERKTVSEGDLHQMEYLKAVVKETLRLRAPVPMLVPREALEDVVIDGYDIPAKTRIFINAWAIGREAESWENPEAFEPERFIGSPIDYKGQDFAFIPFGSGRRVCPGITFSVVAVEIALAQLLHSFDWELPPGTKASDLDLTEVFGISVQKRSNLILVAKPRHV